MKTQEKAIERRENMAAILAISSSILLNAILFIYTPLWVFIVFQVLSSAVTFWIYGVRGVKDQEAREAMEAEREALEDAKEEAEYKAWKESLERDE